MMLGRLRLHCVNEPMNMKQAEVLSVEQAEVLMRWVEMKCSALSKLNLPAQQIHAESPPTTSGSSKTGDEPMLYYIKQSMPWGGRAYDSLSRRSNTASPPTTNWSTKTGGRFPCSHNIKQSMQGRKWGSKLFNSTGVYTSTHTAPR